LGCKALGKRVKFKHRSNATKSFDFVRAGAALALDSSNDCENSGDTMRLDFVSFCALGKNFTTEVTEVTEVTEKNKHWAADDADGTQILEDGCMASFFSFCHLR
jgi:hypothetical protein